MPRAPFQVLVLPYRRTADSFEFAVLCRADDACWQGVAGGGEGHETPLEAARREAHEEAGIPAESRFIELETVCSVPLYLFRGGATWGDARYVIPEYSFGVDCTGRQVAPSDEHAALEWLPYCEARERLTYDSTNEKTAFAIYSVTRPFTAMATMMLVEEGKISLEDPISNHLAGLPAAWGAVKVRQLLPFSIWRNGMPRSIPRDF